MDSFLLGSSFSRSQFNPSVYTKHVDDVILILSLYANHQIRHVNSSLLNQFEISKIRLFCYFLGLQIQKLDKRIFVSQPKYSIDIIHYFHMKYYNYAPTLYQSSVKHSSKCSTPQINPTLYKVGRKSFGLDGYPYRPLPCCSFSPFVHVRSS